MVDVEDPIIEEPHCANLMHSDLVHMGFLPFSIRLTLGCDRHDLAGLERMAQACGTRYLLHP
jgi:hypothetical protein